MQILYKESNIMYVFLYLFYYCVFTVKRCNIWIFDNNENDTVNVKDESIYHKILFLDLIEIFLKINFSIWCLLHLYDGYSEMNINNEK